MKILKNPDIKDLFDGHPYINAFYNENKGPSGEIRISDENEFWGDMIDEYPQCISKCNITGERLADFLNREGRESTNLRGFVYFFSDFCYIIEAYHIPILYWKVAQCFHEYKSLSTIEAKELGIDHKGDGYHYSICNYCGNIREEKSLAIKDDINIIDFKELYPSIRNNIMISYDINQLKKKGVVFISKEKHDKSNSVVVENDTVFDPGKFIGKKCIVTMHKDKENEEEILKLDSISSLSKKKKELIKELSYARHNKESSRIRDILNKNKK